MKAFVLLALAFASYFADVESRMTLAQIANTMKSVRKACSAKVAVSPDLIELTHQGEWPEDRELKCFFHCTMGMMKLLKDGKFSAPAVHRLAETLLPEDLVDRAKAAISQCAPKVTSDDGCDGVYQYVKCNYETDKEVYFFP